MEKWYLAIESTSFENLHVCAFSQLYIFLHVIIHKAFNQRLYMSSGEVETNIEE
jgi:hypothetical protein